MERENGEAAATGCFKRGAVACSVERNGGGRGPMLGRHAARGGGLVLRRSAWPTAARLQRGWLHWQRMTRGSVCDDETRAGPGWW
jgi:hypothetical protein